MSLTVVRGQPNVLLLDPDLTSREATRRQLNGCKVTLHEASDVEAARATIAQHTDWLVLADVKTRGLLALIEDCRSSVDRCPPHVVVVGTESPSPQLTELLGKAVGAFWARPMTADTLRQRVHTAIWETAGESLSSGAILDGLYDGVHQGNGELIVRSENRVFRVLFYCGRVVFVSGTFRTGDSLPATLQSQGLCLEDIQFAMQEARDTAQGFFRILVQWGLIEPERLQAIIKTWLHDKLALMLRLDNPQLLFVPAVFQHTTPDFSVALDDVLPQQVRTDRSERPQRSSATAAISRAAACSAFVLKESVDPSITDFMARALRIKGALSTTMLKRSTCGCEGWLGQPPDPQTALAMLQTIDASDDDPLDELVLTTASRHYLARFADSNKDLVCLLAVDREQTSLGLCKLAFAHACANSLPCPDAPEALHAVSAGK